MERVKPLVPVLVGVVALVLVVRLLRGGSGGGSSHGMRFGGSLGEIEVRLRF